MKVSGGKRLPVGGMGDGDGGVGVVGDGRTGEFGAGRDVGEFGDEGLLVGLGPPVGAKAGILMVCTSKASSNPRRSLSASANSTFRTN